eukprot:scpid88825/ scgid4999/ 
MNPGPRQHCQLPPCPVSLYRLVVVGDGKTYDHLLSLMREYGDELSWLIPFPGDWHLLKAVHPVLMRVYWDSALKSLAPAMGYRGDTLTILEKATDFRKCHEFLLMAHEAIGRTMLQQCGNGSATFSQLRDYADKMSKVDATWKFWTEFYFNHMMAYISLWTAVRSGNWDLRIAAIKSLAPLFHAFDRTFYLRLVPHHLAHVACMPGEVIDHFKAGAFSVSLSGKSFNSVALDECHEMCVNKDLKAAIVHPQADYIDRLARYLPHRGHVLHNLMEQLFPSANPPRRQQRLRTFAPAVENARDCSSISSAQQASAESSSTVPMPARYL